MEAKILEELPNLATYTVVNIKKWAKDNNYPTPSGINKEQLIQYLTGLYHERKSGIVKQTTKITASIDILQPRTADTNLDWSVHLHTHGWAVVPITRWNPNFTKIFLEWFESCHPDFRMNDYNTWKSKNMPIMLHGILKHYYGHTELQWCIRELCAPIFARLWNCNIEDLLCSYDGGCFLPSLGENIKNRSFKQWIHNDTPRSMPGFSCVQGVVNFEENGPEDGGLVLVEGSHNIFQEYINKHPSEGITWGATDMSDPLLNTRNLIKICAPAGSLILFDGRTFHCNVHPHGSIIKPDGTPRFRMCHYVSMQPRSGANAKELTKRISLYEKSRMTGHWCYGPWFKETGEHPQTYGGPNNRPPVIEQAQLTPLRRRLIGYE